MTIPCIESLTALNWEVVSGLSGALAAVAAGVATVVAFCSLLVGNRLRRAEKRSDYYRIIVGQPANKAINEMHDELQEPLEAFADEMELMRNAGLGARASHADRLVKAVNYEWYRVNETVLGRASAWGDSRLRLRLRRELEKLQDEVTTGIEKISLGGKRVELMLAFREGTGTVMKIIAEADPVIKT